MNKTEDKNKKRIGIFFGGRSREREISYSGGRTVYDNIDRERYIPVPIFVDSVGNFVLLKWEYIYKGCITDFYPIIKNNLLSKYKLYAETQPNEIVEQSILEVGERIYPHQFSHYIDFAFLILHGSGGEDGSIQGILDWYGIPHSGSKILGSALGLNKIVQKRLLQNLDISAIEYLKIDRREWLTTDQSTIVDRICQRFLKKIVIKSATQGSTIGVSVSENSCINNIKQSIDKAFFVLEILSSDWSVLSIDSKKLLLNSQIDITTGIGFPVKIGDVIYRYDLDKIICDIDVILSTQNSLFIEGLLGEESVLIEEFIEAREFSCIVLHKIGSKPIALPPTEMYRKGSLLSYQDKYMPGEVNKSTPINLPLEVIKKISNICCRVFEEMNFRCYARIDGFIDAENKIYINDPNTTAGMLPSSFLFQQTSEIGLSPKQLITFVIENS